MAATVSGATTDAVYVANGGETVTTFAVNPSTGELTSLGATWYGTDCGYPNSLALDPQGGYLYAACSEEVSAAVVGPPLAIAGTTAVDGQRVSSLTMHPTGISVYVSSPGAIYQIPVSGFDLQGPNYVAFADSTPGGLALDPLGRFLYATEGVANVVQAETVAETAP